MVAYFIAQGLTEIDAVNAVNELMTLYGFAVGFAGACGFWGFARMF